MITTAVGNYPKVAKPGGPNLRRAIALLDEGKIPEAEVKDVQRRLTEEVLKEQAEAGLDMVTDGQIAWEDGQTYFAERIQGFQLNGLIRYFDTNTYYRQPLVRAKVAWQGPISVEDYQFATSHGSRPVKAVITGPYTLARLSSNQHYSRFEDLVLELAQVLNQEAMALEKAGAPIIQFDEPAILKGKGDFPLFKRAMETLTRGLGAKTALYTYFGDIDGLYPGFLKLPFQVFGLDFVMGQRNFEVLKSFPGDVELGLGIMDARNTRMEAVEEIVQAVRRISSVVPLGRLHINPSCGLEFLPRDKAHAKLIRMVEGVRRAQEVLAA